MDYKNLLIEILMNHITSVTLYHDKEGGRTSQANIIFLQRFDELADKIISEGFSRRPELNYDLIFKTVQIAICDWQVNEVEVKIEYKKRLPKSLVNMITDAICKKLIAPEAIKSCKCRNDQEGAMTVKRLDDGLFQCPRCGGIIVGKTEAKQREVKWPEKVDLTGFKDGYGKGSRDHIIAAAWNQAIDACKKAYEEAQPASSVNAEVVEALQALLVAVCYKTPTVDFGTQKEPNPCYEARVPVQFVHDAHKALDSIKAGKDTKCS